MGFDPHGEVFYGYDLGDLMAPDLPDDADPPSYRRTCTPEVCIAPAWMLANPVDPWLGLGEGYGNWEEEYARRAAGWAAMPFPEEARKTPPVDRPWAPPDIDRDHPAYVAWSANLARKREIVASAGCDLSAYGTFEGTSPDGVRLRVAVTDSIVRSCYDCVPFVPGLVSTVVLAWTDRLHRFLDVLEIPRPAGGPGWHLTSDYG